VRERGADRDRGVHAGDDVGDGDAGALRPAAGAPSGSPVTLIMPPMPWIMKS